MFFAAALSIGPMLTHLKLTAAFGHLLARSIPVTHLGFVTALELSAVVQAVHIPIGTVTAAMATVSPILQHYAVLQHISPVLATWIVVGSAQAYLFPYQNPTLLMVYNEGYWDMKDMIKIGALVSLGALLLVPLSAITWWAWTVPH
jgi:di/tricarboxylate transporter